MNVTEEAMPLDDTPKYTTTRRRWLTLASFLLMICFNHLTIAMFIPIIPQVQAAYMLAEPLLVSMCAIIWPIQAIPMNFISIWLFNNYSYTNVLSLASCFQFFGAWFRSYSYVTGTFWPIMVGTAIQSLSASMFWQS